MTDTKRTEVLLESDAYERLEGRAAREGVTVPDLIRRAVQDTFLASTETRRRALDRITSLDLAIADWDELEEEILGARASVPR